MWRVEGAKNSSSVSRSVSRCKLKPCPRPQSSPCQSAATEEGELGADDMGVHRGVGGEGWRIVWIGAFCLLTLHGESYMISV